eukprot:9091141-Prorocentrum_lima.AAC.1
MTSSLVGSEMCIRDRLNSCSSEHLSSNVSYTVVSRGRRSQWTIGKCFCCLLYTSDAADDM